jgi:hypothetical protein
MYKNFKYRRNSYFGFLDLKVKEKSMNSHYKFSFVASVVGFIFSVLGAVFLFSGNPRLHEISLLISLFAVSVSVFTTFNLIPSEDEKRLEDDRRDHDLNYRFESIWREIERIQDNVDECKNSCKTSGKSR